MNLQILAPKPHSNGARHKKGPLAAGLNLWLATAT
jgi:hypothetical protein